MNRDEIIDTFASLFTRTVSISIAYPIHRVLVVLQTQDVNRLVTSGKVPRYTRETGYFSRIYKDGGLRSLWRGNSGRLLYGYTSDLLCKVSCHLFPFSDPESYGERLGQRIVSIGFLVPFVYPLEFATTRLASHVGRGKPQFTGLRDCLSQSVKGPRGIIGIYSGSAAFFAGFMVYHTSKDAFYPLFRPLAREDSTVIGLATQFITTVATLECAEVCAFPFKVMSRRLQMDAELPEDKRMYKNARDYVQKVVKSRGVQGLFPGIVLRVQVDVAVILSLVIYFEIKNAIKSSRNREARDKE